MLDQIRKDHKNAKRLAEGINKINGLSVDIDNIKSNILYFTLDNDINRSNKLSQQTCAIDSYPFEISLNGVQFFESKPDYFRLVTHYGISSEDIETAILELNNMVK